MQPFWPSIYWGDKHVPHNLYHSAGAIVVLKLITVAFWEKWPCVKPCCISHGYSIFPWTHLQWINLACFLLHHYRYYPIASLQRSSYTSGFYQTSILKPWNYFCIVFIVDISLSQLGKMWKTDPGRSAISCHLARCCQRCREFYEVSKFGSECSCNSNSVI